MQYPDIGILYDACDQANVTCGHIYIARDPYSIIKSTTIKRKFNPSTLEAIKMYTGMLSVIYMQMLDFPDRTAACWRYEIPSDALEIGRILGWQNRTVFENAYAAIYKTPSEPDRSVIPEQFGHYMKSMIRLHNQVLDLCMANYSDLTMKSSGTKKD